MKNKQPPNSSDHFIIDEGECEIIQVDGYEKMLQDFLQNFKKKAKAHHPKQNKPPASIYIRG